MAQGDIVPSDRRRVTVRTLKGRLLVCNTFLALFDLVADITAVARTGTACLERHIGILHVSDVGVLRYADMTRRAVLICMICRLVTELKRVPLNNILLKIRLGEGMAARAVTGCRFDVLVMARKTRCM